MLDIGVTGYVAWFALGAIGVGLLVSRVRLLLRRRRWASMQQEKPGTWLRIELAGCIVLLSGGSALWAAVQFDPPRRLILLLQTTLAVGLLLMVLGMIASARTQRRSR